MTEQTTRDADPDAPGLDPADGDDDYLHVAINILGPGDNHSSCHRHVPLGASDEQLADALVRCVLGMAASHGSASLMANVFARMRQEVRA